MTEGSMERSEYFPKPLGICSVCVVDVFVQERDLERLKAQWLTALTQRQENLDQQLQSLVSKPGVAP